MRFTDYRTFKTAIGGKLLQLEIGKVCEMANGQVMVRYGDTVVNVTAVASKEPRPDIDFFPLSCDFEEKMYAAGKIPGGFIKREGRPSEKATSERFTKTSTSITKWPWETEEAAPSRSTSMILPFCTSTKLE